MNKDMGTTEALMLEANYKQISAQELRQLLLGNTILGDFAFAYKYIMTIGIDGSLEGINNVGSLHVGQLIIADADNTISVQWRDGWENTTSRAYVVDEEIKLYNIGNGRWSTTFTEILRGTEYEMKPPL